MHGRIVHLEVLARGALTRAVRALGRTALGTDVRLSRSP
jgi:hypothetical protein